MGDNEQLIQFINWLQQTKFPDASVEQVAQQVHCLLYTSDAADD